MTYKTPNYCPLFKDEQYQKIGYIFVCEASFSIPTLFEYNARVKPYSA